MAQLLTMSVLSVAIQQRDAIYHDRVYEEWGSSHVSVKEALPSDHWKRHHYS